MGWIISAGASSLWSPEATALTPHVPATRLSQIWSPPRRPRFREERSERRRFSLLRHVPALGVTPFSMRDRLPPLRVLDAADAQHRPVGLGGCGRGRQGMGTLGAQAVEHQTNEA